jgi:hypothetical protein
METVVDIGYVSGFLTVTRKTDERIRRGVVFECQCVCGNTVKVSKSMLRLKEKKSCGCKSKAETSGTHGWYGTPTHNTWRTMRDRCYLPTHKSWKYYGGKGVTVCDEWKDSMTGFLSFLADMGERPEGTTLDRKDSTKGYCKENCRWSTASVQQTNKLHGDRSNKKSKWLGVFCSHGKWVARIRHEGTRYYLGCFETEEQAARAYNEAGYKLKGGDFHPNTI